VHGDPTQGIAFSATQTLRELTDLEMLAKLLRKAVGKQHATVPAALAHCDEGELRPREIA